MQVLATQGLAACTGRQVAAVGHLTKSAIHYYFADMDVLIDRAMGEHVANFAANLRKAADLSTDPVDSFWNVISEYLATFRDQPNITYLWLEYWVDAVRKGRLTAIDACNQEVTAVLTERLEALDNPRPADAAQGIFVFLLGEVLAQLSTPAHTGRTCQRIAALTGIDTAPPKPALGRFQAVPVQ